MRRENLLILHGALGSKEQFEDIQNVLSENYNVYTMNFEGHGGRRSDKRFAMSLFAENVNEFLTSHNLERTHIFGYSMGGYVALTYALNYPQRVRKIVTLGTKFDWSAETAQKEASMLNPELIQKKVPHFARRLERLHAPNKWPELVIKTSELLRDLGRGQALNSKELQSLSMEIHICLGELDNMVSKRESEEVADILRNGSFLLLEGTKHPIEQVDSQLLCSTISRLLNR